MLEIGNGVIKMNVEEIMEVLYPQENELSDEQKIRMNRDRQIVAENLDEFEFHAHEGRIDGDTATKVLNRVKTVKYLRALYPSIDDLTEEQLKHVGFDRGFIFQNMESFEDVLLRFFPDMTEEERMRTENLRDALDESKVRVYFATLYPQYNKASLEDKYDMQDDKNLIRDNLRKIDAKLIEKRCAGKVTRGMLKSVMKEIEGAKTNVEIDANNQM